MGIVENPFSGWSGKLKPIENLLYMHRKAYIYTATPVID